MANEMDYAYQDRQNLNYLRHRVRAVLNQVKLGGDNERLKTKLNTITTTINAIHRKYHKETA